MHTAVLNFCIMHGNGEGRIEYSAHSFTKNGDMNHPDRKRLLKWQPKNFARSLIWGGYNKG